MKKIIILMMLVLVVGCTHKRTIEGIDLNQGILVDSVDARGWFNDGEVCEQYDFSSHPIYVFEKPFIPLDDIYQRLVNDYIHDELFEEIEQGYYYLVDHQNDTRNLFERSSMNIEMIVCDLQTNQLYYILLNT